MDLDEDHHAARRRIVANVYSMSSILESEPYIDDCTNLLEDRLTGYCKRGEVVDISRWFNMSAQPFSSIDSVSKTLTGMLSMLLESLCMARLSVSSGLQATWAAGWH